MSFAAPPLPGRARRWLGSLGLAALDLVYPRVCAACGRAQTGQEDAQSLKSVFCEACAAGLPWVQEPYCERCGEMFDGAINGPFACSNCDGVRLHFDYAVAACPARDEVREMIHRFKYGHELHLRRPLSLLLARALEEKRLAQEDLRDWCLVPVPLHPNRELEREYNQSWELCVRLSELTGIPAAPVLERIRETEIQARLTRLQRQQNLRGAFRMRPAGLWRPAADVRGRKLLLVDDVFTTGSTTSECARVLTKEGGAARVVVITVARG